MCQLLHYNKAITMTDRCITNCKVNEQLHSYKSDTAQSQPLNTFFCRVHPLDSFAKGVDRVVKDYEVENDVGTTQTCSHRSSSAVQGLVHATAKVFHREGAGVPQELKVYLKLNGIDQNIVHYFVGERFHLYFHNGGAVYYVALILLEFLNKVWEKPNQLP